MKKSTVGRPGGNSWELLGARLALGPEDSREMDVSVQAGRIVSLRPSNGKKPSGKLCLDLRGLLIMPGLINAHDHLEFNLFPRLGSPPYRNAGAWARDVYHPESTPVREHLAVPLDTRLQWGAVKNLLGGATTVCHHNPFHRRIFAGGFAVRVPGRYGWAHSLEFSADVLERFRGTPRHWPFIVHVGEAVDTKGREEVWRLDAMRALDERTVLVHAVALDRKGLELVHSRGASLVWCPSSNTFILGRTLGREPLNCGIPVALGTDSALTGEAGLLEEIRFAARTRQVSAARLYEMVTSEAARVMRLKGGEGRLVEGGVADFIVAKDSGNTPAATLLGLTTQDLEFVFVRGEMKLVSPRQADRLPRQYRRGLQVLRLMDGGEGSAVSVCVAADVDRLFAGVEPILGNVVLAHRRVLRAA